MKLIPKISNDTKQTLYGGIAASLAVYLESGLAAFVPAYPQFLKDKVSMLPRNGALVANVAPMGVAWAITRKRSSARMENMKTGIFLYDLPKLLDNFVYSIAYQMGVPQQTQSVGVGVKMLNGRGIVPMNYRAQMAGGVTMTGYPATGSGKYVLKVSPPKTALGGGLGKYR